MIEFSKIEEEYMPSNHDDDSMRVLKERIFNELTEPERRLLIAYCEIGSFAGLARFFHNSTPTARKRIKEIIRKICY